MVIIDDLVIYSTIPEILQHLKLYLSERGINFFREIKVGQDNVMVSCPFHKDGNERKASCGISLRDVGETKAGTVHCFTCGKITTFTEMISYCLGYNDKGEHGLKWLKDFINFNELDSRSIDFKINRGNIEQSKYVSEEELDSYRYYHPYMYERKLTKEVIIKYDVGYDKNTDSITFPVKDDKGNVLFIARRNVKFKLFNYPSGSLKPLYGIYESDKNADYVIITESIINCLTCISYGYNAIALNGTGSNKQIQDILKLPYRVLILALDNDEAGDKGCLRIKEKVGNKFILKRFIIDEKGKDINDLTKDEFTKAFCHLKLF